MRIEVDSGELDALVDAIKAVGDKGIDWAQNPDIREEIEDLMAQALSVIDCAEATSDYERPDDEVES